MNNSVVADPQKHRNYHYLTLITVAFTTVLIVSNIVSTKITTLWWFTFDAGTVQATEHN